MFQCKAQTPCDNWLGFSQYDCSESILKDSWIQQQYELVQAANQQALRTIFTEYAKECWQIKPKVTTNSRGKLGLLRDHPEGHK